MSFMIRMVVALDATGQTSALAVAELAKRKTDLLVRPVLATKIVNFVIVRKKRWLNKTASFLDCPVLDAVGIGYRQTTLSINIDKNEDI